MKTAKGCKSVTIQVDEKLLARARKVLGRLTLAELMRRGLVDLVEKMERGQVENRNWSARFDGSRKGTTY